MLAMFSTSGIALPDSSQISSLSFIKNKLKGQLKWPVKSYIKHYRSLALPQSCSPESEYRRRRRPFFKTGFRRRF
jgi:hypothetical protein